MKFQVSIFFYGFSSPIFRYLKSHERKKVLLPQKDKWEREKETIQWYNSNITFFQALSIIGGCLCCYTCNNFFHNCISTKERVKKSFEIAFV